SSARARGRHGSRLPAVRPGLGLLPAGRGSAVPEIPIGAIFDSNQIELKNAFFLALQMVDKSRFKLKVNYTMTNVNSSHSVQQSICHQLFPWGAFAIFGSTNAFTVDSIQNLVSMFHVPYITPGIVKAENPKSQDYVLNIRPRHGKAIIEVLEMYQWTTFAYVVNSHEGLHRFQETVRIYQRDHFYRDLNVQLIYVANTHVAYPELARLDSLLKSQSRKHVVIDLDPPEVISDFLPQIREMGMNRREYHYLATGMSVTDIDTEGLKHSGVNLTGFQLLDYKNLKVKDLKMRWEDLCIQKRLICSGPIGYPLYEIALLMDGVEVFTRALDSLLSKPDTRRQLLDSLAAMRNPANRTDCVVKDDSAPSAIASHRLRNPNVYAYHNLGSSQTYKTSHVGELLMKEMTATRFDGYSGSVAFDSNGFRSNFTIDVMELKRSRFWPVGYWHTHSGLEKLYTYANATNHTSSMKNDTTMIRVVTIETPPFVNLVVPKPGEPEPTGNDRFEGFCIEMFDMIAEQLGIKYSIHIVHDKKFGAKVSEDPVKWNGMIGELLSNQADIAVASLTISPERAEFVHFTEPFLTFGISIMIKKPKKEKPGTFSFLRPLSQEVWIYIVAGCVGVSLGLYLCARISPLEWQVELDEESPPTQKVSRNFSLLNSMWFSFAAFVNQGVDLSPKSSGARMVASVWWFFTLIMIAYYTATLAAFLTVELLKTPISNWEELAMGKNGILPGTLDAGSTKAFFTTTNMKPYKQIGEKMEEFKHQVYVNSTDEGVRKVRESKGKYAFLLESKTNEYHNNLEPCDTMMVGQPHGDKGYGIATPIGSPLREKLNDAVLRLREKQVLDQLYKKWWVEKGQCISDSGGGSLSALAVINVAGVFYILVAGLGIALLMALLEFYYIANREVSKSRVSFAKVAMTSAREKMFGQSSRESTVPVEPQLPPSAQCYKRDVQSRQLMQSPTPIPPPPPPPSSLQPQQQPQMFQPQAGYGRNCGFAPSKDDPVSQRDFTVPVHVHYNNTSNEFQTTASDGRSFLKGGNLM
ncbi:hypothetical protein BOX15_Mlig005617g1, partial [Macrostomum lignano]